MKLSFLLEIEESFERQAEFVEELMDFDKFILEFCISSIEQLNERLKNGAPKIINPTYLADNVLQNLRNIRNNESMKRHYKTMYNQGIVLLVSHFTSTLTEIFKKSVQHAGNIGKLQISDDIKFNFKELQDLSFNLQNSIGDLILKKKEISFQDMQSAHRAFKNYLDIDIPKDEKLNDIILAHAVRHCIVHNLGFVNDKLLAQVSTALPRSLKKDMKLNDSIQISKSEINFVKFAMLTYFQDLIEVISQKLQNSTTYGAPTS